MCTKFGVDSSSRFPVTAWTNRQTHTQTEATVCPTHAGGYAGVGSNLYSAKINTRIMAHYFPGARMEPTLQTLYVR